jgi:hypothetical protein
VVNRRIIGHAKRNDQGASVAVSVYKLTVLDSRITSGQPVRTGDPLASSPASQPMLGNLIVMVPTSPFFRVKFCIHESGMSPLGVLGICK